MKTEASRTTAILSACTSALILLAEHVLTPAGRLDPVDHWLSEYVLSDSQSARLLMHICFCTLALAAASIAWGMRERFTKGLFAVSGLALFGMTFFNTAPNDGRHLSPAWPLASSGIHQICLYIALGASFAAIALVNRADRSRSRVAMFWIAVVAVGIQTLLVALSTFEGQMTHYGGITERVIVACTLAWLVVFARKGRDKLPTFCGEGSNFNEAGCNLSTWPQKH